MARPNVRDLVFRLCEDVYEAPKSELTRPEINGHKWVTNGGVRYRPMIIQVTKQNYKV